MPRIQVLRSTDDLTRRCWEFTILDFPKVHLEYYGEEERATRRHKWKSVGDIYTRLDHRRHGSIKEEPEVPADVVEEALAKFAEQLEFRVWRNR